MSRYRQAGFTLIEVLIAMTLLGVMVVLLFSSLRIAAESWNAGEDKIAAVNQKAVVYQFFKRHLSTIRPLPMLDYDDSMGADESQVFQGYPQSLRFAAALPAASLRKGLQIFQVRPDPKLPSTLQVSLKPYRPMDAADTAIDPPVVLLAHVRALQFAYFGKIEETADARWLNEWVNADHLPDLIKIRITLQDGSYWPDMIFPLKITANPAVEATEESETDTEESGSVDTH